MSADPTFTVVMPAFNAAATIEAAIRSVLAQTRSDYELVVVDDGSTDDTAARVEAFADGDRVRLLRQENRGLAGARNTALEAARGRYVSLLDSDDLWLPTYLERVGAVLDSAPPDVGLVYVDAWFLDDETGRIGKTRLSMLEPRPPEVDLASASEFLDRLLEGNFVFVAATIRASALEDVGRFDSGLRACEDYELWLRLAARGFRALRIKEPLVVYRRRAGSLSRNEELMLASLCEVYGRYSEEVALSTEQRAQARRRKAVYERALATEEGRHRIAGATQRGRRALGAVKRRLLDRRLWYRVPPPPVARAFPGLVPASSDREREAATSGNTE